MAPAFQAASTASAAGSPGVEPQAVREQRPQPKAAGGGRATVVVDRQRAADPAGAQTTPTGPVTVGDCNGAYCHVPAPGAPEPRPAVHRPCGVRSQRSGHDLPEASRTTSPLTASPNATTSPSTSPAPAPTGRPDTCDLTPAAYSGCLTAPRRHEQLRPSCGRKWTAMPGPVEYSGRGSASSSGAATPA